MRPPLVVVALVLALGLALFLVALSAAAQVLA
jgi:hypothetical protein